MLRVRSVSAHNAVVEDCAVDSGKLTTCNTLPKLPSTFDPAIAALAFISAFRIVPSARFPDVMVFDAISDEVMPLPLIVIAIRLPPL
jgi:hypothetical protein